MFPPEYVRRATAEPIAVGRGRLLLLVLEGGQAFLVRARTALERGDLAGFVTDVSRTQDVLLELAQTLDRDGRGDIAARLERLHGFLVGHLARGNAERSLDMIDEMLRAYEPIIDAYREVMVPAGSAAL